MFGFLNVYKPKGLTSFDVIRKLRAVLKIKQIGHTGTLDPLAEGVLPVCIGKATKLINYLNEDKAYIAELKLGFVSETYDTEAEIKKFSDKKVTREQFCQVLKCFNGKIKQTPPVYSAIKVKGKKLYEYARAGRKEEVEIPSRTVVISGELLDFDEENQTARISVSCSKGTYIRSLVNDIGLKCETGAVMSGLLRTKSGKFDVKNSIELEKLDSEKTVKKYLINPLDVLSYSHRELTENEFRKIVTGQKLRAETCKEDEILLLTKDNRLVSVAEVNNSYIKGIRVFV